MKENKKGKPEKLGKAYVVGVYENEEDSNHHDDDHHHDDHRDDEFDQKGKPNGDQWNTKSEPERTGNDLLDMILNKLTEGTNLFSFNLSTNDN